MLVFVVGFFVCFASGKTVLVLNLEVLFLSCFAADMTLLLNLKQYFPGSGYSPLIYSSYF